MPTDIVVTGMVPRNGGPPSPHSSGISKNVVFGTRRKNQNTSGVRIMPGIWNSRSFQPQAMPPASTMAIRNRPIKPPISCIFVYSEANFCVYRPAAAPAIAFSFSGLDFALRLGFRDGFLAGLLRPGLHLGQAGHDLRHLLNRAEGDAERAGEPDRRDDRRPPQLGRKERGDARPLERARFALLRPDGRFGQERANEDQRNRRDQSRHQRVPPRRVLMNRIDRAQERQEARASQIGRKARRRLHRDSVGDRDQQPADRRKRLRVAQHRSRAACGLGNSSASQATAATNSTHTPMNTRQRKNSSIHRFVEKPAANAEKAYSRMLHVSTRRRPRRSVR